MAGHRKPKAMAVLLSGKADQEFASGALRGGGPLLGELFEDCSPQDYLFDLEPSTPEQEQDLAQPRTKAVWNSTDAPDETSTMADTDIFDEIIHSELLPPKLAHIAAPPGLERVAKEEGTYHREPFVNMAAMTATAMNYAGCGYYDNTALNRMYTAPFAAECQRQLNLPLPGAPQPLVDSLAFFPPPTQPAPLDPLSIGSQLHSSGACTPCKFFHSKRGCRDGTQCTLCHHPHTEMTFSSIKQTMRRKARAKQQRAITTASGTTAHPGKNTFIHIDPLAVNADAPLPLHRFPKSPSSS